jgi:hypothetical protein
MPQVVDVLAMRSSPRSVVRRLRLRGTWCGHDQLIIKQAVGEGAAKRFVWELAALRFLASLDIDPPVAPRLFAWDASAQLLLLEDLGDHSLATTLLGQDRAAAHTALVAYATGLGRLHARTAGRESGAAAVGEALEAAPEYLGNSRGGCDGVGFRRLCEAAGVAVDAAFDDDLHRVDALLTAPGAFRVLTHGDPCPGNERLKHRGVVFFDFEASAFNHALLDGTYLNMAFPTCWCVGAIPPEVLSDAQAVYRETLAAGVPQAADAAIYSRHLLYASARWLLTGDAVVPRAQRGDDGHLLALLAADWSWGPSTARQRLLCRLLAFRKLALATNDLLGLAEIAFRLHRTLASRWPTSVHSLANFPAFSAT